MKTIHLIFGCHSHQPVGNFDSVFEMAYDQAYKAFFDVLERYPAVKVTQHFTGPLLDWFKARRPEFLERLSVLAKRGQVEIMGGGYYEPLLCAIPERDSIAQIHRMQTFCEEHFGVTPRGMWLTERVWEPHMPRILNEAGIEYTALDDTHFLCAGHSPQDLFGYYLTEEGGHPLKVFPILERLRYLIPFQEVYKTIDFLRENATEDGLRCAVIHDDGEKFGVWPQTHMSVYGEGWLEALFTALTENREWIRCSTYSEYIDKAPAVGRTYLPTASYHEMMEWALPTPMQRRLNRFQRRLKDNPDTAHDAKLFVRGSFWRSFLAKYAETNNIQKKMLRVSEKFDRLKGRRNARLREAERLLHEGQCNCAYWHGVFGGLYLNHLRTAVYERLIAAEAILDEIQHGKKPWVACERVDFDADGYDEAILENSKVSLAFSAKDGGTLFEWDFRDKPFNFENTLTRREEAYHDLLREGNVQVVTDPNKPDQGHSASIHDLVRAKEFVLETYLVYDPYRRVSMRDHFLANDAAVKDLWAGTHAEFGDFATGVYSLDTGKDRVVLSRSGVVRVGGNAWPVTIQKTIRLEPDASSFEIRYDLRQEGDRPLEVMFGVEFAANLLTGSSFDRYYRSDDRDMQYAKLGEMGRDEGLRHLALRDDWQRIECGLRFSEPARVYRFAIETVSQSEGGQERVYQGSIVLPCWALTCAPGETVTRTIMAEAAQV